MTSHFSSSPWNLCCFCKWRDTCRHRRAHTSWTLFQMALELEEDRGLLRRSIGPWGWQRGHDCLPCQPPLPGNSTETKPHQRPQLTTKRETKRGQYFNSLPFVIHQHPLTAICAVKLPLPGRKTGILQAVWKSSGAGQLNLYHSCRMA